MLVILDVVWMKKYLGCDPLGVVVGGGQVAEEFGGLFDSHHLSFL